MAYVAAKDTADMGLFNEAFYKSLAKKYMSRGNMTSDFSSETSPTFSDCSEDKVKSFFAKYSPSPCPITPSSGTSNNYNYTGVYSGSDWAKSVEDMSNFMINGSPAGRYCGGNNGTTAKSSCSAVFDDGTNRITCVRADCSGLVSACIRLYCARKGMDSSFYNQIQYGTVGLASTSIESVMSEAGFSLIMPRNLWEEIRPYDIAAGRHGGMHHTAIFLKWDDDEKTRFTAYDMGGDRKGQPDKNRKKDDSCNAFTHIWRLKE